MLKSKGKFEAIESFVIKRRNEFYIIGRLLEGQIQENWFIHVPLNPSIAMTVRIKAIEEVEITNEDTHYTLLIVGGDEETINNLLALNIGSEQLDVTIEGQD